MGDRLSNNFLRSEFECRCGCGQDTVDIELIRLCEEVREFEGESIAPSSGNRCTTHNKKEGGGKKSQHLYGRAADLPVKNSLLVYNWLCRMYPDQYGFGLYNSFVHVDSRSGKARWDFRNK